MDKKYGIETATALLDLAYPDWDLPPYVIRDDGVYQSDEHRGISPSEDVFDWSPSYDMEGPDAPDPMTAPMLPILFSAAELAVFMLDGAGMMIPEALGCRIGDSQPNLESVSHPHKRVVREALEDAFALVAQAAQSAGQPNYEELSSAHRLNDQCSEANGAANAREGVFEQGISEEERRARRARAVASVQELKERSRHANAAAKQNWKNWRKEMVRALLAPAEVSGDPCPVPQGTVDQSMIKRKKRSASGLTVKETIKPYVADLNKRFPNLTGKLLHSEAEKEAGSKSSPFATHKWGEILKLKDCHRSCSMATFEQVLSQIKN